LAGPALAYVVELEPGKEVGNPLGCERAQVALPVVATPALCARHVGAAAHFAVRDGDDDVAIGDPRQLDECVPVDRIGKVFEHLAAQHGVDRSVGDRYGVDGALDPCRPDGVAQGGSASFHCYGGGEVRSFPEEVLQDPSVAGTDVEDRCRVGGQQFVDRGHPLELVVRERDVLGAPELVLFVVAPIEVRQRRPVT
jgi:hypothetical protein